MTTIERLKQFRVENDLPVCELAEMLGISYHRLADYLYRGERPPRDIQQTLTRFQKQGIKSITQVRAL